MVVFNSDVFSINQTNITIGVKSKPIKGQANKEIINKISKYFKISANQVKIKSGHKSNKKFIEILN